MKVHVDAHIGFEYPEDYLLSAPTPGYQYCLQRGRQFMHDGLFSCAACGLFLMALAPGCSKRPRPPEPEKPAEAAEETEPGVGDVVDYFTGETPLRIKKQLEEKLDRITQEHDRRLQEFLDAGGDRARPARGEEPPPAKDPPRSR